MKLNELTIKKAREGLKNKEFSSVELTSACLEQIKKYNQNLNAFITVCEKEALESARQADKAFLQGETLQDKPLLGIPIALKDLFCTKGVKTTAASNVLRDYVAQYDGTVVKKLKDAGAIIIGKTNLDAWAHGSSGENSDFGPTKNPWSTDYVPGGSSSGSAVSVATNMCIASTGTDTGGSIRLPASFNNVVGLKPTYGRVSRYGIVAMASSLDSIGHFTKTVEDSALLLNITAGRDDFDATTLQDEPNDYTKNLNKGIKGLKIGIPKEFVTSDLDAEVGKKFDETIKMFKKLGAEIVNVSLPYTKYGIAAYYIILPSEVSSNLARYDGIRYGSERQNFGDEAKRRIMLGTHTLSSGYYDAYYKKAMKVRTLIKQDFEKAFEKVDAMISPVCPTLPWKLGEKTADPLKMYLSDVLTVTVNIAGIPSLAVPAGFSKNGLPIGIQIMGKQLSEDLLFRFGNAFEKKQNFINKNPSFTKTMEGKQIMKYIPVIGLEVHVELKTRSKMFCGCSADYFGQKPNTHTCPVCLGLPGALPVPNKQAIEWCTMIGLALNCKIANFSKFDRKNYFYPDLAKGYQISQYDKPFCEKGFISLSNGKKIGITRVHQEEDTGKLIHQGASTLIDFNRSGVPLVEIVTEPDFETASEVVEYLKKLQQIVRYQGVSDADMEKGNMRLEPNISLRKENEKSLPKYKVEVKNINSFRFVEKAIEFEIKRQTEILDCGKIPAQETRGYNEVKNKTISQRSKEEAQDYRYFPEPDIPPILFKNEEVFKIQSQMPELPDAKFLRFQKAYGLSEYNSQLITKDKETADYFEKAAIDGKKFNVSSKDIANFIINQKINPSDLLPSELIKKILSAKQTTSITDDALVKIIDNVLKNNAKAVDDYKKGKINAIMFMLGQVMRQAKQKLDAKIVRQKLEEKLR